METKGINILEKAFRKNNGADATISISHKLYGKQKIRCTLDGFCDEQRIGFKVKNGHDIFIYSVDLKSVLNDLKTEFDIKGGGNSQLIQGQFAGDVEALIKKFSK